VRRLILLSLSLSPHTRNGFRAGIIEETDTRMRPSRLGYLFSGPPGTGKSSLAFALASNFGLPVYMINLSAPGLSDNDIESLFSTVPRHCIVLLEDVDATQPLSRKLAESKAATGEDRAPVTPPPDFDEDDVLPPPMQGRRSRRAGERRGNTVTLSGLLNAIDGVAASEGKSKS
jgi:mitochondrial chaperone BCS1